VIPSSCFPLLYALALSSIRQGRHFFSSSLYLWESFSDNVHKSVMHFREHVDIIELKAKQSSIAILIRWISDAHSFF
jgi:hypothetical protein